MDFFLDSIKAQTWDEHLNNRKSLLSEVTWSPFLNCKFLLFGILHFKFYC